MLCCTLLLFINTSLLHVLVACPCLLIVLFWCSLVVFCYVLLLLINVLLLCTLVVHRHLVVMHFCYSLASPCVHSSCLSTTPCCSPPYSLMLQVHVLHWPLSVFHHLLVVCSYCSLTPPCCVLLYLLAPPCCAFLLFIGTSSWCSLVLFKLAFHLCIFLCRCEKNNF